MTFLRICCTVPTNNLNIRFKTEPVTTGADAWNGTCLAFVYIYLAQKPDIDTCTCANHDRLGFYSEIQISFGTVCIYCELILLVYPLMVEKVTEPSESSTVKKTCSVIQSKLATETSEPWQLDVYSALTT